MILKGGTMLVHGGWIRNAIGAASLEGTTEGWDIVVIEAKASDPEDGNRVVAVMKEPKQNSLPANQAQKKEKLSRKPSKDELTVSDEMKAGKKPTVEQRSKRLGQRRLSGSHKKILVHGYCAAKNPFPTIGHFTDYVEFSDPDNANPGPSNWSHDTFARKIDKFADQQGLIGCGCIAHSQGGAACLHLYTYYWSCLDDASSGSRLIQSLGTPYQGSALSGNLAAIGSVFGAGCGSNTDLSESGAVSWLSNIPSWARSRVHYYTTSFEDNWWSYDYCHLATDLFLSDPEDGATEKGRGQLPGGNNRGHKTGQCHTTGMRDAPQYNDGGRNSEMNTYAQY